MHRNDLTPHELLYNLMRDKGFPTQFWEYKLEYYHRTRECELLGYEDTGKLALKIEVMKVFIERLTSLTRLAQPQLTNQTTMIGQERLFG